MSLFLDFVGAASSANWLGSSWWRRRSAAPRRRRQRDLSSSLVMLVLLWSCVGHTTIAAIGSSRQLLLSSCIEDLPRYSLLRFLLS